MGADCRSLKSGVVGLVAIAALATQFNDAVAASRIFPLYLKNGLNWPITFTIVMGNCYQGTGYYHRNRLHQGPVYPGQAVKLTIARVQGHGCNGKQGKFALRISGQPEMQHFEFNNEGSLTLTSRPVRYTGYLRAKSAQDESFTWTIGPHNPEAYWTGNFAVRVPTHRCDGIEDTLKKYGGRALNAVTLLNPVRHAVEFAIAGGDPERYLDKLKRDYEEAKTFVGDATHFVIAKNPVSPLSVVHYVSKALPDGKVRDFMSRGRSYVGNFARDVVTSSIDGVKDDLTEVVGDAVKVIKNIDDPEEFFKEMGAMYQKWTPTGAVSLIFTTGDPAVGIKLAAANLLRQNELASTYFLKNSLNDQILGKAKKLVGLYKAGQLRNAGAKKIARKLGGLDFSKMSAKEVVEGIMSDEAKERALQIGKSLVRSMDPRDRKAAALSVGAIVSEMNSGAKPVGYHPFYYNTVITPVPAEWMGDDYKSGSTHDMSHWHPSVEDRPDCISLGDYIYPKIGAQIKSLNALCSKPGTRAVERGKYVGGRDDASKWWSRPIDYVPVWNDSCSGGRHDRSIWAPKCRPGYIPVGFVFAREGSLKPTPNRVACLKEDPTILSIENGQTAGLEWTTNDANSGAKVDVTVYTRNFHGMHLSWAVTGYPGRGDMAYLRGLEVPVARTHPAIVRREEARVAALASARQQAEQERHRRAEQERMRRYQAELESERRHQAAVQQARLEARRHGPAGEVVKSLAGTKWTYHWRNRQIDFTFGRSGTIDSATFRDMRWDITGPNDVTVRSTANGSSMVFTFIDMNKFLSKHWSGKDRITGTRKQPVSLQHPPRQPGAGQRRPVGQPPQRTSPGQRRQAGPFRPIIAAHSGKCLDVPNASRDENVGVNQYRCEGSNEQRFSFRLSNDVRYSNIVAAHSGKCLGAMYGARDNNVSIVQQQCRDAMHQKFLVRPAGQGFINIILAHSGKCLDVPNGSLQDNVGVNQYDCDGSNEQRFRY